MVKFDYKNIFENSIYSLYFFPLLFLWAMVYYTYNNYSPVPFWDSWDGFVQAGKQITDGDWSFLFNLHNQHRILLSKLLYLLDYKIIESHFLFLLFLNLLFPIISFVIFSYLSFKYLKEYNIYFICFSGCFIFLLSQSENFRWEFESQFFLAQIIPFVSFIFFAKGIDENLKIYRFKSISISIFFAIISIFTMANGILAIFILLMISIVKTRRYLLSLLLTILCIFLAIYSMKGVKNDYGTSNIYEVVFSINNIFWYLISYFGSPFYHIMTFYGNSGGARGVARILGFIFSILFAYSVFYTVKSKNKYAWALFAFVFYIFLSGVSVTLGRFKLGTDQAFGERYTTPVIMGWVALILLLYPCFLHERFKKRLQIGTVVLMLIMLPYQMVIKNYVDFSSFAKEIFLIAYYLGVNDRGNNGYIYPDPDVPPLVTREMENDLGFFTHSKHYFDMKELFNAHYGVAIRTAEKCESHIDLTRNTSEAKYDYIEGRLKITPREGKKNFLLIYNEQHQKVGYLVSGLRQKSFKTYRNKKMDIGIFGYLNTDFLDRRLFFYNPETGFYCSSE